MEDNKIIEKTAKYVKKELINDSSGHDWWHTYRVWKTAIEISKKEKADLNIVQLAALLHDIADYKFNNGDDSLGPRRAREWLSQLNVDEEIIKSVVDIIASISFKGANVKTKMKTKEGKVVQDADRLDAMGAIGIARAFAYGGMMGREMHDPFSNPIMHNSFNEYKNNKSTTINHFYEKLLLLKDRINTSTGKKIAKQRHKYMELFLDRFYYEWEGRS